MLREILAFVLVYTVLGFQGLETEETCEEKNVNCSGIYIIENLMTGRYLFQDGDGKRIGKRGSEHGWLASSGFQAPKVVGADANYYGHATWKFVRVGNYYFIENVKTGRYLFSAGKKISGKRGNEGGWLKSPNVQGADANYYNRALWKLIHRGGNKFIIENVETGRYLFQAGKKISGKRGSEGGWLKSSGFQAPDVLGADANYYNRAIWKLIKQ